jgi:DICT domain-containing protein
MTIVIDPTFSVFQLVQRTQEHKHLIRHRKTMSQISFEIEDATLESGRKTRIFAGFQYMSKFLPQLDRYRKMAAHNESIYVFGIPDVPVPAIARVHYVKLSPTDQLSKEWFVVGYGRNYASALATEEISTFTDPDHERVFNGVWTFNPLIVSIIGDWISSAVDAQPIRSEVDDITHQQHVSSVIRSIRRVISQIDQLDPAKLDERQMNLRQELETVVREELQPHLISTP